MAISSPNVLVFQSEAISTDDLHVVEANGHFELSRPYSIDIDLASESASVDIKALVGQRAQLGVKQSVALMGSNRRGVRTNWTFGIIESACVAEQLQNITHYRVRLVPSIQRLKYNFRSRIFQATTIKDMVAEILRSDYALAQGEDFDFRLGASWYPKRDYIVQYQETDFEFISRWLEHEGVFYFFEQTETGDRIVFADDPAAYKPMHGSPALAYRPAAEPDSRSEAEASEKPLEDWFREEVVSQFRSNQKLVFADVLLRDYNYREVRELTATATASSSGFGTHYQYNEHFKGEGDDLANVRAQEINCREVVFEGASDCRSFRPGVTFELFDHFRPDYNINYLLTAVDFRATQAVSLIAASAGASYTNRFSAIPADRVFRPMRDTEWPSIKGVMHGRVTQTVDDQGRYKVKLPFDLTGNDSRWMRMAQPYTGAGFGMHMRLLEGAEVLVVHIDGDPDRPIIASAVPNPETSSVVNSNNITENVLRSQQGNQIVMDDTEGAESMTMKIGSGGVVTSYRNTTGNSGSGSKRPALSGKGSGSKNPADLGPSLMTGPYAAMSADAIGGLNGQPTGMAAALGLPPHAHLSPSAPGTVPFLDIRHSETETTSTTTTSTETASDAEDEFFTANTTESKANFTTWLGVIHPTGADYVRTNAAKFEGVMGSYEYYGGFKMEAVNGSMGLYVNGGTTGEYREHFVGKQHKTFIKADEIGERVEVLDAGTHIFVQNADTTGDQIISGGLSEFVNCPKIYSVTDMTTTAPTVNATRTVNSSTVADGEKREDLKCKKITENVEVAGDITSTTTLTGSGNKTETTTAAGTLTESVKAKKIDNTTDCKDITETIKGEGVTINVRTGELGKNVHTDEIYYGTCANSFYGAARESWFGNFCETFVGAHESFRLAADFEISLGGKIEVYAGLWAIEAKIAVLSVDFAVAKFKYETAEVKAGLTKVKTKLTEVKTSLANSWSSLMTKLGI